MGRIAALCRTYSATREHIVPTVEVNRKCVESLRNRVEKFFFSVWRDRKFPDSDCGGLHRALHDVFAQDPFVTVRQSNGDIFVNALNNLLDEIYLSGYDAVLVISATSAHFITSEVDAYARTALFEYGVDAVAVVPPDVPSAAQGAITNQCAYWSLSFLKKIGWFDPIDTRPVDFRYDRDYQGVAELANLFKSDQRQPLAVIHPNIAYGDDRTRAGDPKQLEKLRHKERRIDVVLGMLGKNRADLASLIRESYPVDLRESSVRMSA
jgi:hypothetical protein